MLNDSQNEYDLKITKDLKDDSINLSNRSDLNKEMESTKQNIEKLQKLRNQVLFLDRERIKKRINLQ